eukprot:Hpha_TRINITY_DN15042_c3_g14::TRINITY_DN15042_c3_g14_i1::g.125769::m.125769
MPITGGHGRTVSPPRRALSGGSGASPAYRGGVGSCGLEWSRWVSGKESDWTSRCECLVGGRVLVLAGASKKGPGAPTDSTFSYDLGRLAWSAHTCTGNAPSEAAEHRSVSLGGAVFVWFELGDQLACSMLDTQTWEWSPCFWRGDAPQQRRGFSLVSEDSERVIWIHGGTDALGLPCTATHRVYVPDGSARAVTPAAPPPPRESHAAVFVPAGLLPRDVGAGPHMVIWGGRAPNSSPLCDMWALDLESEVWYPLAQHGETPPARWGHSLTLLGGVLVLYGGEGGPARVRVFELSTQEWLEGGVEDGELPEPRVGHYAAALEGQQRMVVFGGREPWGQRRFFDVYGLKVSPPSPRVTRRVVSLPAEDDDIGLSPVGLTHGADHADMSAEVRLLEAEQELNHLREENARVRSWESAEHRDVLTRTVASERARWQRGAAVQNDELHSEAQRIASERDEAFRQRDELLEAAMRRRTDEAAGDRRIEEEIQRYEQMQTELADRYERMQSDLAERTQRIADREAQLLSDRAGLEADRASLDSRIERWDMKESTIREEMRADAMFQAQTQVADEVSALKQELREERASRQLAEEERQNALQELSALRAELSAEKLAREEEAQEHEAALGRMREEQDRMLDEEARMMDGDREAREAAEAAATELRMRCSDLEHQLMEGESARAQLADQVAYWRSRALPPADPPRLSPRAVSPPRTSAAPLPGLLLTGGRLSEPAASPVRASPVRTSPAPPVAPVVQIVAPSPVRRDASQGSGLAGVLSPAALDFLAAVGRDTAKGCGSDGGMPLAVTLKVLRALRLLRGGVTVDSVLDVLHAAQMGGEVPGEEAPPPLADCIDEMLFASVVVDITNRLYGSGGEGAAVDADAVNAHIMGPLRQLWGRTGQPVGFPEDPVLDCILSLPSAEVLHRHRRGLLAIFCRSANIPFTPGQEPSIPHTTLLAPRQVADVLQRVGVVPKTIARHQLLTQITPLCDDGGGGELSPAGFEECLCRCALLDAVPSGAVLNPVAGAQRCAAVIQQAVSAHRALTRTSTPPSRPQPLHTRLPARRPEGSPKAWSPKASSRTGSPASSAAQVQMSPRRARELLGDREGLKRELQRVWLYYSALSSAGGTTPQYFVRCLADSKCLSTRRDFADSTPRKERSASGVLSVREAEGCLESNEPLGFDDWTLAMRRAACKLHPALAPAPAEALQRMLLEKILPYAHRASESYVVPLPDPTELTPALAPHRRGLQTLQSVYGLGDAATGLGEWSRMCAELQLVPQLLSKQEAAGAHRSSSLAFSSNGLDFLVRCLSRAAHLAFSKPPFLHRLTTHQQRVVELASRLHLSDPALLKRSLDRAGRRIPPRPVGTPPPRRDPPAHPPSLPPPVPSARTSPGPSPSPAVSSTEHPLPVEGLLDDEERLDATLKSVFAAYGPGGMIESSGWLTMCNDSRVLAPGVFDNAAALSTFRSAIGMQGEGARALTFDGWCDALLLLGSKRFISMDESSALRTLLTQCVLPWASRR